ncbi:MAG: hypothetical protein HY241_15245 [Actinobacteria bacterium]|nr:hypothetical protein [Actinomycetota bacterium]
MTISDLRCDRCGCPLSGFAGSGDSGPTTGVRFAYHPGDRDMRDDSGTLCGACWQIWNDRMGEPVEGHCSVCGTRVSRYASLHLRGVGAPKPWRLCPPHTADLLNELRTVAPKFDREAFRLPLQTEEAPTA